MAVTETIDVLHLGGTKDVTDAINLLAIEPLGHGVTSTPSKYFSYWDTAIVALQALDVLGIKKAFGLGTSQGGWMVVRMALLAPERIQGLIILGTSLDYESADSREKGGWDPFPLVGLILEKWTSATPNPKETNGALVE
ncbi:Alpha/Beta hydrolase protein [Xylogone sp. PMI_703]|nr:Alpha/Beta hydrolase protein [Xylogone sp. PMI_703]